MAAGRVAAIAAAVAFVVSGTLALTPASARAATAIKPPLGDCLAAPSAAAKLEADRIMGGHLKLGSHSAIVLAKDPTWRERPFHSDQNWLFNYHALRWILVLLQAGRETGEAAYIDRAAFLLKDWLATNSRSANATLMSWNDMTAGWRASVLACATIDLGFPGWLVRGLRAHGVALADPTFYSSHGNHALNQVNGLVDIACALGSAPWKSLAARRFNALVLESVDADGVTNEQSVGYQLYNFLNYERARRHLEGCHLDVPAAFDRLERMPDFLAYATAPDGYYEQLGDTDLQRARPIVGTISEFAARAGLAGQRPVATLRRFAAGYYFARSGWGSLRPFEKETAISLRFGPGSEYHGQDDGQSITLSAGGRRLLVDPGKYTYTRGPWKDWFASRAAHNVVLVDGVTYDAAISTGFGSVARPDALLARMTNRGYPGVTNTRRVVWARAANYLIVDDALSSSTSRTFRQTWHLPRGSAPTVAGNRLDTRLTGANLAIVQLIGRPSMAVVSGSRAPIQGWVSETYNVKFRAPVLQTRLRAKTARFLTLLVPYTGAQPTITGRVLRVSRAGYVVEVTIGRHTERVTVKDGFVSVTSLTRPD